MEQGGFDFRKPSERREARRFEPPPWEQEAFEELRRQRTAAEAEQVAKETKGAAAEAAAEEMIEPQAEAGEPQSQVEVAAKPAADAMDSASGTAGQIELDDARVLEMMAGLAAESPRSSTMATHLMMWLGALIALFGLGLMVWGWVLMARAQGSARTLSLVLVVMGLAYIGVGASMGYRALKERGVL